MRKFLGIYGLVMVAGFAFWTVSTRVPLRVIGSGVPGTIPPAAIPAFAPDRVMMVAIMAVLAAAIAALAYTRYREGSRHSSAQADRLNANVDDRLARIEQTLEAVALEVERIGEMERFATKLLAAREKDAAGLSPLPPSSPPRVITPH